MTDVADKRRRPKASGKATQAGSSTPGPRPTGGGSMTTSKQELLDDLGQALARLADASERMRQRLDQVDSYEQPAKWAAINDQIRGLDERISGLRDEHQRLGNEFKLVEPHAERLVHGGDADPCALILQRLGGIPGS